MYFYLDCYATQTFKSVLSDYFCIPYTSYWRVGKPNSLFRKKKSSQCKIHILHVRIWELRVKCKELAASAGAAVETKAEASRERHSQRITTTWRGWWGTSSCQRSPQAEHVNSCMCWVLWTDTIIYQQEVLWQILLKELPPSPPTIIPTLLPRLNSPWITLAQLWGPCCEPKQGTVPAVKRPQK